MTSMRRGLDIAAGLLAAMALVFVWRPFDGWVRFVLLFAIVGVGLGAERLLSPNDRKRAAEPPAVRAVRTGLDIVVDLLGSAAWALAMFVLGARLISTPAGGLLGLATFI